MPDERVLGKPALRGSCRDPATTEGLHANADTPPFLLRAHASVMDKRAERGGKVEHKVRQIARRVMSQQARDPPAFRPRRQADRARAWNQAGNSPK